MSRLRLPFGRRVLVLVVLLLTLIVLLPMRLAVGALGLEGEGVTARAVRGSVWAATIRGLAVPGVALGDVHARLSPWALLVGRARIELSRVGDADPPLSGALLVGRNLLGIDGVDASLPLGSAFAPLPVGAAQLNNLSVRFEGGACAQATGGVRVTLTGGIGGPQLTQGLSGNARCDGRYLRLPLASQAGRERLDLRVTVDGDWIAELAVADTDPARAANLAALGFAAAGGVARLRVTGRF